MNEAMILLTLKALTNQVATLSEEVRILKDISMQNHSNNSESIHSNADSLITVQDSLCDQGSESGVTIEELQDSLCDISGLLESVTST